MDTVDSRVRKKRERESLERAKMPAIIFIPALLMDEQRERESESEREKKR